MERGCGALHRARSTHVSAAAAQWRLRVEAAVLSRGGVAGHRTALALWGLVPPGGPVHVTVGPSRSNRRSAGVVLHRTRELQDAIRSVDGVPVTCVERALVDTWGRPGDLTLPAVRAAVITAVRRRMCRPRDLATELDRRPQLRARAAPAEVVRLLAEGCQSELQIWGCLNVLRHRGCRPSRSSTGSWPPARRTSRRRVRGGEARGRDGRRGLARVPDALHR